MNNHSSQSSLYPIQGWLAVRIFCCFALAYLLSYGLRAINAVIAPSLMADLNINNSTLGAMSSAYFIGFFVMQFPLGHWLDKHGSRKSESILLIFSVLGAAIFAMADQVMFLAIGRGLIGVGVSACLMSAFTYYGRWFKPEVQGSLASGMLMCGTAGAMLMSVPVQMALPSIGWRGVFWVMVGLLALSVLAIRFGIPSTTDPAPVLQKKMKESDLFGWLKAYYPILKSGTFLQVMPMGIFNQGGFYAIQTLWLGAWFKDLIHLRGDEVANHLLIFNLILLLGYGVNIFLVRFLNQKGISTYNYAGILSGIAILMQILALFVPNQYAAICLFMFGLASTSFILAQSLFIQNFPRSIAGKASTSFNMLIFSGAIVTQWGIGVLIDVFMSHGLIKAEALQLALYVMLALQLGAYIWMWLAPKVLNPASFILPSK